MTAHEIEARAHELLRQAAEVRERERAENIGQVREMMKLHGLTIEDIGGKPAAAGKKRGPAAIKYRNAQGQTWTGRGKRPRWIADALDAGHTLSSFAV